MPWCETRYAFTKPYSVKLYISVGNKENKQFNCDCGIQYAACIIHDSPVLFSTALC